jgi:RNA polymerase sigma factor (sigma-70 family)
MTTYRSDHSSQSEKWAKASDSFLLEVLRGENPEDVQLAMSLIQEQYVESLRRHVRNDLRGEDRVDDILGELWLRFYDMARLGKIQLRENLRTYLHGIARNLCSDAIRSFQSEVDIELDRVPAKFISVPDDDQLEYDEARLRRDLQLDHLPELPFLNYVLSDCERVLWALREVYRYPVQTIARLLDKKLSNASWYLNRARAQVVDYFNGEDFEHALAAREYPRLWGPPSIDEEAEVIERFTEELTPRFTPEELSPLGLSMDELRSEYVTSLMIPRWFPKDTDALKPSLPYMLLARRQDWPTFQRIHTRMAMDPSYLPDEFPEESLIKLDISGKHIKLGGVTAFQMVPEDPDSERLGNTYVALHDSRRRVPSIMAFIGSELYTDEFRERWPFLQPGWENRELPEQSS